MLDNSGNGSIATEAMVQLQHLNINADTATPSIMAKIWNTSKNIV
jgi:hypothetical protein